MKWTRAELDALRRAHKSRPAWMTDYELAGRMSRQLNKSPEAVRWQIRQFKVTEEPLSHPKILLLDIETLPMEALVFGAYKQDIRPEQIKKPWSIVCWSAKWLFDRRVFGQVVSPKEAVERQDASILEGIWKLVNEAHVVIAHNGMGFDFRRLNTRFLIAGFPPPMHYKAVDTLRVLRDHFAFTHNHIDAVARILGIGMKMETSFKWWDECSRGSPVYLKRMLEYNKKDAHLLEELYLKLRPWIPNHPNVAIFDLEGPVEACRVCGSRELRWSGVYLTSLNAYRGFRCQRCGSIGRSTRARRRLARSLTQ